MIGLTYIMQLEGVTGKELADRLGVSPPTVSQWEKQVRPIPKNRLPQLSEMFPEYDFAYFQKELNEVDKLTLENVEKEKQIRSLSGDDTLNLIQERRRLQNEICKNETLIKQQEIIDDAAKVFGYTYSLDIESTNDVCLQKMIIKYFSSINELTKKMLYTYFMLEEDVEESDRMLYGLPDEIDNFYNELKEYFYFIDRIKRSDKKKNSTSGE